VRDRRIPARHVSAPPRADHRCLSAMGAKEVAMARRPIEIDRDKLRAAIRKLGDEYVFHMLDDTIDLLPPAKLHKFVRKYIDLKRLRPDSERATKASLLTDVKAFEKASLAGEYYEPFNVNSRNFMEKFKGTTGWIARVPCAAPWPRTFYSVQ